MSNIYLEKIAMRADVRHLMNTLSVAEANKIGNIGRRGVVDLMPRKVFGKFDSKGMRKTHTDVDKGQLKTLLNKKYSPKTEG
jgi:hypothetical protein